MIKLRAEHGYDTDAASVESGLECKEPSLTKQAMADEVDINTIAMRYGLYGEMPVNVRMPTYGDFTGVTDFRSALDAIRLAQESFMEMPAQVRSRFGNDPQAFVEFCSDPANADEAVKLGLVDASRKAAALVAAPAGAAAPAGTAGASTSAVAGPSTVS